MATYKLISADSHIVEPPDMYTSRVEPKFRDRAPRMERRRRPRSGSEYDAWFIDGMQVGTLGAVIQAGQRFEDPSQIDFLGRLGRACSKAAYEPQAMIEELEIDGVWGACLQPSQGLFWYRIPDSAMLSAICRSYNDWIADFCKPYPERLKGIAMLNVDDVDEACQELERCVQARPGGGLHPGVSACRTDPIATPSTSVCGGRRRTWRCPCCCILPRTAGAFLGCEFTMNIGELTAAGRSTTDHWVRYSLSAMIFAGIFDRYPRLQGGLGRARDGAGFRTG